MGMCFCCSSHLSGCSGGAPDDARVSTRTNDSDDADASTCMRTLAQVDPDRPGLQRSESLVDTPLPLSKCGFQEVRKGPQRML